MKVVGSHIYLSTKEWNEVKKYPYSNAIVMRDKSLQEVEDMGFCITPTGFTFEMEGTV